MSGLRGKTLFISGASRGIGLAIALRAARDGANIAVAAKTDTPDPRLPGTIFTAAEEIEKAGGQALPIKLDIRDADAIEAAVAKTAAHFGGIDICINNASAISLTGTLETPVKRFDLMNQVNGRATFLVSRACIPYLKKASNPHILTLSPPLNLDPKWFGPHVAYTMAKYAMSFTVLGMAEEFKKDGIAVNALWPRTAIATAALQVIDKLDTRYARRPEIMADAAYWALTQDSRTLTGQFLIDDEVMAKMGVTDLTRYAVDPTVTPMLDFFVEAAR